jgi:hypothetical protein
MTYLDAYIEAAGLRDGGKSPLVVNIRTSPVVFDRKRDNRTLYAVDVTGGDRSSATSRRMSANRFRGMATSAIWKAT